MSSMNADANGPGRITPVVKYQQVVEKPFLIWE
jgi:hypothetical protein